MALKPVRTESLREQVAATLRESILDGTFQPGERLTGPALAKKLATSRGPVREALRELEQEGLVRSSSYQGARVVGVSREEVEQVLVPIRLIIEEYAFRRAVERLEDHDLDTMAELVAKMRDAALLGEREQLSDLDIEFHRFVIDRAGQEQGAQIWQSLQPRIRAHFRREQEAQSLDSVADEHELLLSALRTGDIDVVAERIRDHVLTYPSSGHSHK